MSAESEIQCRTQPFTRKSLAYNHQPDFLFGIGALISLIKPISLLLEEAHQCTANAYTTIFRIRGNRPDIIASFSVELAEELSG